MDIRNKVHVHIPYPMLLKRFDDVLEAGLNPEVYLSGESLDGLNTEELESIRKGLDSRSLGLTIHGPYMDLSPGGEDERVRGVTVERFAQVFEAAQLLRPKAVVLHAGYEERRFDGDSELWLRQSLKTWPRFVEQAQNIGAVIAAENIFEHDPSTLRALVLAINSPHFKVCLDSGHLNLFSEVPMQVWFEELGPFIGEFHLHDNNGQMDDHLPIGDGSIDFPHFFRLLKEHTSDAVYTIEPHGEDVLMRGLEAVGRFL